MVHIQDISPRTTRRAIDALCVDLGLYRGHFHFMGQVRVVIVSPNGKEGDYPHGDKRTLRLETEGGTLSAETQGNSDIAMTINGLLRRINGYIAPLVYNPEKSPLIATGELYHYSENSEKSYKGQ